MRDRNKRKVLMYGLMVALMVTTVAYALLSTTLNINGTVTKKGGSWDIHFANLVGPTLKGDATATTSTFQATAFSFTASVLKPTDSITYEFDVVNAGSIDAILDTVSLTGAAEAASHDIIYTLTYEDGSSVNEGDKLLSGASKGLILKVEYDEDATTVASEDITLNLGATLIYRQLTEEDNPGTSGEIEGYLVSLDLATNTSKPANVYLVKEDTVAMLSPKVVRLSNKATFVNNETGTYLMTYNNLTKKYEAIVPETGVYSVVAEADKHIPYTISSVNIDSHKSFTITLVGGDIDGDGTVDYDDYGSVVNNYNTVNTDVDTTGDGYVDWQDLFVVLNNYNKIASYEGLPPVAEPGIVSFELNIEEATVEDGDSKGVYKIVVSVNDTKGDFRLIKNTLSFDNNTVIPVDYYDGSIPNLDENPNYPFVGGEFETGRTTRVVSLHGLKWTLNGENSAIDFSAMWNSFSAYPIEQPSGFVVYEMYFKLAEGKTLADLTEDSFKVDFLAYANYAAYYYGHDDESLNTIIVNNNIGK